MRIERHPIGVWVREDGAIYVPQSGTHAAHWTFGSVRKKGYHSVTVARKVYLVHRLVAEAFHGPCPSGKPEIDHIDRCPSNNAASNLRYCSRSENMRNTGVHEACVAKYGVASADDRKTYNREYARTYLASSPKARERTRTRNNKYYGTHREEICAGHKAYYAIRSKTHKYVRFSDGSQHWIPNEAAVSLLATPLNKRIFQEVIK